MVSPMAWSSVLEWTSTLVIATNGKMDGLASQSRLKAAGVRGGYQADSCSSISPWSCWGLRAGRIGSDKYGFLLQYLAVSVLFLESVEIDAKDNPFVAPNLVSLGWGAHAELYL